MGWYARHYGEDEELWRAVGLLHDFDYERHPTLDKHPQDGAPILRDEGYPEEVIDGVLSHAEHLELPRDTQLKKTLFACDELSGFVHSVGLLRPHALAGAPGPLPGAVRFRPPAGPRPSNRARGSRAEVGEEEAEAAVVFSRRA